MAHRLRSERPVPSARIAAYALAAAAASVAHAEPVEALGRVTATNVRTSFLCSWFVPDQAEATFDAKLDSNEDNVVVRSTNGEFSCALSGKEALSAAAPCQFTVGGGSARTPVECPAHRISGHRAGPGVFVTLSSCKGSISFCDVEADLVVTVAPK
jgi:hypothetical protein